MIVGVPVLNAVLVREGLQDLGIDVGHGHNLAARLFPVCDVAMGDHAGAQDRHAWDGLFVTRHK